MDERLTPGDVFRRTRRIARKLESIIAALEDMKETPRAAQKRQVQKDDQLQHLRDGEGGPSAKAGGGG